MKIAKVILIFLFFASVMFFTAQSALAGCAAVPGEDPLGAVPNAPGEKPRHAYGQDCGRTGQTVAHSRRAFGGHAKGAERERSSLQQTRKSDVPSGPRRDTERHGA